MVEAFKMPDVSESAEDPLPLMVEVDVSVQKKFTDCLTIAKGEEAYVWNNHFYFDLEELVSFL